MAKKPSAKAVQPKTGELVPQNHSKETVAAMFLEQFGNEYKPTEAQFDKMIALREKAMDYTHRERTMFQPKNVLEFGAFAVIILLIGFLLWVVTARVPQYTGLEYI